MPIQTNRIEAKIDYSKLDSRYDFFVLATTEQYIKGGAQILDVPSLDNKVQSIVFISGKCFYIMMIKDSSNKTRLKDLLYSNDEGKHLTIAQKNCNSLDVVVLLQLLVNAISASSNPVLSFNNLTGHLYCFHPAWLKHKRTDSQDEIIKIPCLEIRISGDCRLSLNVKTFCSTKLKNKISFRKKKIDDYPKYCLAAKNTLKRATQADDGPYYILRQTDGAKTEIPFLDIQSIDKFLQSKMGILSTIIDRFNEKYADVAAMELCNIEEYNRIDHKKKDDKQKANLIISRLKEQKIHIIDQIGDRYSDQFCKDIVDLFEVKYGVRPSVGSRLSKSGLNIIIIHNAAYYIDLDDPHDIIKPEYAIQHITLEDFSDCAEFAVSTVVNELIIKNDLRFGNISLFEWKSLGLKNDVLFGTEVIESETEVFVFMRIHPDGSFEIRERELDLFSADDYMKYVGIYEDAKATSENICGIICDDYGNINIIKETDWFSIPNISGIKEELLNDNNKLRGKTERVRLLDAILDIKWFEKDGGVYYFANDIGEGMRPTVQRAANIRQICAYKESRNLFKDLVPLLDVTFVRNGQLTVLPFPFKYLREYIKLHYSVNDNN